MAKSLTEKMKNIKEHELKKFILVKNTMKHEPIRICASKIYRTNQYPQQSDYLTNNLRTKLCKSFQIKQILEETVRNNFDKRSANISISCMCGDAYSPKIKEPKIFKISPLALHQNDQLKFKEGGEEIHNEVLQKKRRIHQNNQLKFKEEQEIQYENPPKRRKVMDMDNYPNFEDEEIDVVD